MYLPTFKKTFAKEQTFKPWQLQDFGAGEGNLQRVFELTSGTMKKPGLPLGGVRQNFKPREGWEDIWKGLTGATQDQRAKLDEIFGSFNTDVGRPGKFLKRNKDALAGFMEGANAFLYEKGDWDWDFEANKWFKTDKRLGREKNEFATEIAKTLPGKRNTMGASWADLNIEKKKY